MRRFLHRLKWLFTMAVLLAMAYGAFLFYFTFLNPIAAQVRANVMNRVVIRHTHFLTYQEIPATYREAMISTEDRSFHTNIGIDLFGIARSLYVDVLHGTYVEGGSTITQQLIRNAYLDNNKKTMTRKLTEAFDALGLTRTMSKEDIFALYSNDIYFGEGAYGLYSAAVTYFGQPPQNLNEGELTMLAGLPNAPSAYDPFHSYKLARERQQIVVENMVENQVITKAQANQIIAQPIRLRQPSAST